MLLTSNEDDEAVLCEVPREENGRKLRNHSADKLEAHRFCPDLGASRESVSAGDAATSLCRSAGSRVLLASSFRAAVSADDIIVETNTLPN